MPEENPFADVKLSQVTVNGVGGGGVAGQALPAGGKPAEPSGDGLNPLPAQELPGEVTQGSTGDATWKQASCHTVTAVVGAGVLGLPFAFSYLGWFFGLLYLATAMSVSYYTSWQLAGMHEQDGLRINRYRDLGMRILGRKNGRLAIVPFQFMVMLGLAITYTVTGAQSMHIIEVLNEGAGGGDLACRPGLTKFVFIFGLFEVFLSQIPSFNHLWWVSIVGAAMSVGYSLLAGLLAIASAGDFDAQYGRRPNESTEDFLRQVFVSLGAVTFAYGGHSVLLEIQATLKAPPSTHKSMMKGVTAAYTISGLSYFFVAISGYAAYGNAVAEDVLLTIPPNVTSGDSGPGDVISKGWVSFANIMVLIHVVAAFQVFSQPIFEAIETPLREQFAAIDRRPRLLRLVNRTLYVLLISVVAAAFPFFQDLMGLIGAVGFIPMTFIMPCVLYVTLNRGRLAKWEVLLNGSIIVLFTLIALASFIAAAANIAEKSSDCTYSTDFDRR